VRFCVAHSPARAHTTPRAPTQALPGARTPAECAAAVPLYGKPGTPQERTFLMVKPDGVARGLVHDIIGRWEKRGFTLVAIKILYPDQKLCEAHYADLSARPFFKVRTHACVALSLRCCRLIPCSLL
jgi:hypothetical protein